MSQFFVTLHDDNVTVIQTLTQTPTDLDTLFGDFNLGLHVSDNPINVHANRAKLLVQIRQTHPHIKRISWLNQVHGEQVYHVTDELLTSPISADAQMTTLNDTALAIMTADCVPIMISDSAGKVIASVHAGWQGLAKGVIAHTVQKIAHQIAIENNQQTPSALVEMTYDWRAWVGACIAQASYEVDNRVKQQVLSALQVDERTAEQLFRPNPQKQGHYFADLANVAELQLNHCGIANVMQSELNSHSDDRFYSYRRQTQQQLNSTGRMATLIFKNP